MHWLGEWAWLTFQLNVNWLYRFASSLLRPLQMWLDYSLQWNASDFGNIQVIRLPAEKLWKPDIILYNKWVFWWWVAWVMSHNSGGYVWWKWCWWFACLCGKSDKGDVLFDPVVKIMIVASSIITFVRFWAASRPLCAIARGTQYRAGQWGGTRVTSRWMPPVFGKWRHYARRL